ncbi:hypothetical protein GWI33_002860 [Rhynchophorus ferrugineus]|uniref:Uncharacterized protein n=1 Tax=Rhynchophorus ferrugineus TaxID=354439 RepID=A0A834MJC8_RHYFE|nr:hypothetical protein GWI33_002860 [Rhynchophorus ferrugineus]
MSNVLQQLYTTNLTFSFKRDWGKPPHLSAFFRPLQVDFHDFTYSSGLLRDRSLLPFAIAGLFDDDVFGGGVGRIQAWLDTIRWKNRYSREDDGREASLDNSIPGVE